MPKTKKKEINFFNCQFDGCYASGFKSYDDLEEHGQKAHNSVYEKIQRGYYLSTLPFVSYSKDPVAYDARKNDEQRLYEEFKNDLEIYHNVKDNSKRDLLYCIAWEKGHSYGLNEVALEYSSMVELIK